MMIWYVFLQKVASSFSLTVIWSNCNLGPSPWLYNPALMPCYFLKHALPYHWDSYPEVSSHFAVFSGFSGLLQSGVELSTRWLSPKPSRLRSGEWLQVASPSCSNMHVPLIRAVNRFWSTSPPSLLSACCPPPWTPSVIQKEPRSRQTRHIHTLIR